MNFFLTMAQFTVIRLKDMPARLSLTGKMGKQIFQVKQWKGLWSLFHLIFPLNSAFRYCNWF